MLASRLSHFTRSLFFGTPPRRAVQLAGRLLCQVVLHEPVYLVGHPFEIALHVVQRGPQIQDSIGTSQVLKRSHMGLTRLMQALQRNGRGSDEVSI